MTATIAERVAAGAAFLDEREPGWDRRINLETLDLFAPCRCVLGQLATDFKDDDWDPWGTVMAQFGLRRWSYDPPLADDKRPTDAECGFNSAGEYGEYEELTEEWQRVILARQEAGAA